MKYMTSKMLRVIAATLYNLRDLLPVNNKKKQSFSDRCHSLWGYSVIVFKFKSPYVCITRRQNCILKSAFFIHTLLLN